MQRVGVKESTKQVRGVRREVLGIPTATAKSRVRYALLKLAEELKPFRRELES